MKIQVLGSGCPTCKKFHKLVTEAVKGLELDAEVEYITDIKKTIEMGIMSSPVLAIDGKAVISGRVPSAKEIEDIIKNISK